MVYFFTCLASGLLFCYHEAQRVSSFFPGLLNSLVMNSYTPSLWKQVFKAPEAEERLTEFFRGALESKPLGQEQRGYG